MGYAAGGVSVLRVDASGCHTCRRPALLGFFFLRGRVLMANGVAVLGGALEAQFVVLVKH